MAEQTFSLLGDATLILDIEWDSAPVSLNTGTGIRYADYLGLYADGMSENAVNSVASRDSLFFDALGVYPDETTQFDMLSRIKDGFSEQTAEAFLQKFKPRAPITDALLSAQDLMATGLNYAKLYYLRDGRPEDAQAVDRLLAHAVWENGRDIVQHAVIAETTLGISVTRQMAAFDEYIAENIGDIRALKRLSDSELRGVAEAMAIENRGTKSDLDGVLEALNRAHNASWAHFLTPEAENARAQFMEYIHEHGISETSYHGEQPGFLDTIGDLDVAIEEPTEQGAHRLHKP